MKEIHETRVTSTNRLIMNCQIFDNPVIDERDFPHFHESTNKTRNSLKYLDSIHRVYAMRKPVKAR